MDWSKRTPFRNPYPRWKGYVGSSSTASASASTSAPVKVTTELTDPELVRLEGVEVVLPESVELVNLMQQSTALPLKGRLIDSKILAPNRISFTIIATTELGSKMIGGLKEGKVNIVPSIFSLPDGKLRVTMQFNDIPEAV